MRRIFYLPIEPYEERYTWQLKRWTEDRFDLRGVKYRTIEGDSLDDSGQIELPVPLDPYQRSYYALTQTAYLIDAIKRQKIGQGDAIYLQDMFHPGIEAIAYLYDVIGVPRPALFVQNCAQSMDVHDFTHSMLSWMRHYELMVDTFVGGVFVASSIHEELMRAAGFTAPIYVTGLPYDSEEVKGRVKPISLEHKDRLVVFTSRFDREKQPHFFMDLVEKAKGSYHFEGVHFAICTSSYRLKSNDQSAVDRARKLDYEGKLTIFEGLAKNSYYSLLAKAKVHFNCALQDFWSNTLNEAATLGTPTLAPCYRSFPEAIINPDQLYTPWSIDDAMAKMLAILNGKARDLEASMQSVVARADDTLDRVIDVLVGESK